MRPGCTTQAYPAFLLTQPQTCFFLEGQSSRSHKDEHPFESDLKHQTPSYDDKKSFDMIRQELHKPTSFDEHINPSQIFRFLELPAEIRTMIYGYVFTNPSHKLEFGRRSLHQRKASASWKLAGRWRRIEDALPDSNKMPAIAGVLIAVSLLRACRQIYDEAFYLPWTTNLFAFHDGPVFHRFCRVAGAKRELIQQIEFKIKTRFQPFNLNQEEYYNLPGLKMLHMYHHAILPNFHYNNTCIDIRFEFVFHALGGLQNHLRTINRLQEQKPAIAVHLSLCFTIPSNFVNHVETVQNTIIDECQDKIEIKRWRPFDLFEHSLRFEQVDECTLDCVLDLRRKDAEVDTRM